jgi:uncharacterized protein YigE (DUF2233 family)
MRPALYLLLLMLSACGRSDGALPGSAAEQARSSCSQQMFEGSQFTVCAERGGRIEVRGAKRSFGALDLDPESVAFGMNAGMFDDAGKAIGLLVEDGREIHRINRREGGGNFHLLPNGVFLVRSNGRAAVVSSKDYQPAANIRYASQSGPMLVIGGKLHPKFNADGQSRYVRNGVGVAPDGTATFVISDDPVSFGKLARFFRDRVKARDALYFDGSVSSLWDPAAGRQDSFVELGPMVVVFRKAGEKR